MSVNHAGSRWSLWKTAVAISLWLFAWTSTPTLAANYLEANCDSVVSDAALPDPSDDRNAALWSAKDRELRGDVSVRGALQSDEPAPARFTPARSDEKPLVMLEDGPSAHVESSVDSRDNLTPNMRSEAETKGLDASIPGVSDDQLLHFKRQMYRKDI